MFSNHKLHAPIPRAALLALAALLIVAVPPALGCPNCKEAVLDEDSAMGKTAMAYNWSILAMLGILGLVGFGVIRLLVIASRESTILPEDLGTAEEQEEGAASASSEGAPKPVRETVEALR